MQHYTILRLLLAGLLLYIAWPLIPFATSQLEVLFWGVWLVFLGLVVGGNFAALLQIIRPPVMEQTEIKRYRTHNH